MKTWLSRLLVAMVVVLTAVRAEAQQSTKVPRIGYLGVSDPSSSLFESFRQGLRELSYLEGQNIIVETRFAYGNNWRLFELAAELVRSHVDVIVAQGGLNAAMSLTKTIPIVMTYSGDPVAAGIIASLERPGGNVTGTGGFANGLGGKWLELLKETVPGVRRVGVLYTTISERESPMIKDLEIAARPLQVALQPAAPQAFSFGPYFRGSNVGAAFSSATRGEVHALIVLPASIFDQNPIYLANLAIERRIPSVFSRAGFANAGGLMSYGANQNDQFRRAAYYVDKILKGARPAELPIESPKKFELTINLNTAKEIGINIPTRILAWADKVIK